MCREETFPARGEVQHRQGDGEQRDRVQGGEQEPELLQKRGGESGESPPVLLHGEDAHNILLQVSGGHKVGLGSILYYGERNIFAGQARGPGASSTQNRLAGLELSLPQGGAEGDFLCV